MDSEISKVPSPVIEQSNTKTIPNNHISVLLMLIILLIGGYFAYDAIIGFPVGSSRTVVVGPKWLNQAQFAGMFVAAEEGIYKNHGLDVVFEEFSFEKHPIDRLNNKEIDFAYVSAEGLLLRIAQGQELTAVAAIYQTSPYALVSLQDSEIDDPSDFSGRILGSKGGTIEEELFYFLMLQSVGLTENDVDMRHVGFDKREVDDIRDKDVDVIDLYRTDQLYFFDKEGVEYNIIYPERFGVNIYNDIIVTRNDLIVSDPDLVRSFVRATIEGWELAFEDPESAVAHTLKYVTSDPYKNAEYERFILDQSEPLIRPDESQDIGIMSFSIWDELFNSMYTKGLLEKHIDVFDVFTNEFLK